jgi:hypothetical protein
LGPPTKDNMLYGCIPVRVTGKIDLDATAKILAPIFMRKYEAELQAREQRSQIHLVDIPEGTRVP